MKVECTKDSIVINYVEASSEYYNEPNQCIRPVLFNDDKEFLKDLLMEQQEQM